MSFQFGMIFYLCQYCGEFLSSSVSFFLNPLISLFPLCFFFCFSTLSFLCLSPPLGSLTRWSQCLALCSVKHLEMLNFDSRRGIFLFLNHLNWSSLILSAKIPPLNPQNRLLNLQCSCFCFCFSLFEISFMMSAFTLSNIFSI